MKAITIAILATFTIQLPSGTARGSDPRRADDAAVEAVRQATARYADITVARAEGWSLELTGCMESEQGAMGYHFGNESFLGDGGQLDPTTPEALMYEPRADGSLRFVGVEYIVPFTDWEGAEPPTFMDHEMIPNADFQVWTLHLWLVNNPKGTYVGWNPDITCTHAMP